jgi:hypothetical protein
MKNWIVRDDGDYSEVIEQEHAEICVCGAAHKKKANAFLCLIHHLSGERDRHQGIAKLYTQAIRRAEPKLRRELAKAVHPTSRQGGTDSIE